MRSVNIGFRTEGHSGGDRVGKAIEESWRYVGSRTCQGRRWLGVLL